MKINNYYVGLFLFCIAWTMLIAYVKRDAVRNESEYFSFVSSIIAIDSSLSHRDAQDEYRFRSMTINNVSLSRPENVTRRNDLIIGIYVVIRHPDDDREYEFAQTTLRCYAKLHEYRLQFDYIEINPIAAQKCQQHVFMMRRHCMASLALSQYDWMLFIDADVGVVNPYHLIEEYIDDRVNIIFYDRLFNWEIATGGYLVRNSSYSQKFLSEFASSTLPNSNHGSDNGAIHDFLVRKLTPHAEKKFKFCQNIWSRSGSNDDLFSYEACTRAILGENRIWPNQVKIVDKCEGWARDSWITQGRWSPKDFMIHGWKPNFMTIGRWKMPITQPLNISNCASSIVDVWRFDGSILQSDEIVRRELADFERTVIVKYWNSLGSIAKFKP